MFKLKENDTICALATPVGVSAICVVRMSGVHSWQVIKKLVPSLNKDVESHKVYLTTLVSSIHNQAFDEVLVTFFAKGKSYTGEESVEISCHGSMAIAQHLLECLVLNGARLAEPGEFTFRAFMNGRIDLLQAEAVLNIIHSESVTQAAQNVKHLRGIASSVLLKLEEDLILLLANLEASIDFSTEGIETLNFENLKKTLLLSKESLNQFLKEAKAGNVFKQGVKVALFGEPNAGKSTLFNNLMGEDRAIVTAKEGTTRDLIEGSVFVEGVKLVFVDSAGVRESDDEIESLGIEKSINEAIYCDIVYLIINPRLTKNTTNLVNLLIEKNIFNKSFFVVTHFDLLSEDEIFSFNKFLASFGVADEKIIWVNNKDKIHTKNKVIETIKRQILVNKITDNSVFIHSRQFDLLIQSENFINKTLEDLELKLSPEFLASSLRQSLWYVQKALGKDFDDEILDKIFSEFCIGK